MNTPLSYKDAGVDIDAGDALVERIKPLAKKTMRDGVLAGIGGFGALFEAARAKRNLQNLDGFSGNFNFHFVPPRTFFSTLRNSNFSAFIRH